MCRPSLFLRLNILSPGNGSLSDHNWDCDWDCVTGNAAADEEEERGFYPLFIRGPVGHMLCLF